MPIEGKLTNPVAHVANWADDTKNRCIKLIKNKNGNLQLIAVNRYTSEHISIFECIAKFFDSRWNKQSYDINNIKNFIKMNPQYLAKNPQFSNAWNRIMTKHTGGHTGKHPTPNKPATSGHGQNTSVGMAALIANPVKQSQLIQHLRQPFHPHTQFDQLYGTAITLIRVKLAENPNATLGTGTEKVTLLELALEIGEEDLIKELLNKGSILLVKPDGPASLHVAIEKFGPFSDTVQQMLACPNRSLTKAQEKQLLYLTLSKLQEPGIRDQLNDPSKVNTFIELIKKMETQYHVKAADVAKRCLSSVVYQMADNKDSFLNILKIFQALGFTFNEQDEHGDTVLHNLLARCHYAKDHTSEIQYIVDSGFTTTLKNQEGKTAYDIAIKSINGYNPPPTISDYENWIEKNLKT